MSLQNEKSLIHLIEFVDKEFTKLENGNLDADIPISPELKYLIESIIKILGDEKNLLPIGPTMKYNSIIGLYAKLLTTINREIAKSVISLRMQ